MSFVSENALPYFLRVWAKVMKSWLLDIDFEVRSVKIELSDIGRGSSMDIIILFDFGDTFPTVAAVICKEERQWFYHPPSNQQWRRNARITMEVAGPIRRAIGEKPPGQAWNNLPTQHAAADSDCGGYGLTYNLSISFGENAALVPGALRLFASQNGALTKEESEKWPSWMNSAVPRRPESLNQTVLELYNAEMIAETRSAVRLSISRVRQIAPEFARSCCK